MNMCAQFVKKSLINLSRLNAKPPIYFVQVAFHLLLKCVDLYICPVCRTVIENPKEFIQPAPFVLPNDTFRARFAMSYMHSYGKIAPVTTA